MKYRKLDAHGDMVFGTGDDFYQNTPNAVGQAAKTRLLLFLGEWFLDKTVGLPWTTQVLGKYSQRAYDTVIKQQILGTQGVKGIVSYNSSIDSKSRTLTVTATLDTVYGITTLSPVAAQVVILPGILDTTFVLNQSIMG